MRNLCFPSDNHRASSGRLLFGLLILESPQYPGDLNLGMTHQSEFGCVTSLLLICSDLRCGSRTRAEQPFPASSLPRKPRVFKLTKFAKPVTPSQPILFFVIYKVWRLGSDLATVKAPGSPQLHQPMWGQDYLLPVRWGWDVCIS